MKISRIDYNDKSSVVSVEMENGNIYEACVKPAELEIIRQLREEDLVSSVTIVRSNETSRISFNSDYGGVSYYVGINAVMINGTSTDNSTKSIMEVYRSGVRVFSGYFDEYKIS